MNGEWEKQINTHAHRPPECLCIQYIYIYNEHVSPKIDLIIEHKNWFIWINIQSGGNRETMNLEKIARLFIVRAYKATKTQFIH